VSTNIDVDIPSQYLEHFKTQLLHLEVSNGEVNTLFDGGGYQDRHELMVQLVKRSFSDCASQKSLRFWVFTGDNRPVNSINGEPLFSISGPRLQSDFVIPDPYLLKWSQVGVDDFTAYCKEITDASLAPPQNRSIVWRGSASMHPVREFIVGESAKLDSSKIDVKDTPPDSGNDSFISMRDLTKWAILCDMPGRGFSGRLKYLLHAYRPVIVFERHEWDAATMQLEPGVHYVSCPPDTQVFTHTVDKIFSKYEHFISASVSTVRLMSRLTERNYVSSTLVKKIVLGLS